MRCTFLIAVFVLWVAGCALDRREHPLAVATVTPNAICANDNQTTVVELSAAGSKSEATLPGVKPSGDRCITAMWWEILGSSYEVVHGQLQCAPACGDKSADCPVQIVLPGDRTATVVLTVQIDTGEFDSAEVPIAITRGGQCE